MGRHISFKVSTFTEFSYFTRIFLRADLWQNNKCTKSENLYKEFIRIHPIRSFCIILVQEMNIAWWFTDFSLFSFFGEPCDIKHQIALASVSGFCYDTPTSVLLHSRCKIMICLRFVMIKTLPWFSKYSYTYLVKTKISGRIWFFACAYV